MEDIETVPNEDLPDIDGGNNLKHFRMKKGFTQRYIAQKIGCSQAMYSMIENSNRMPGSQMIGKLEAAFEMSFRDLFPRLFIGVSEYKQSVFTVIQGGEDVQSV